MELEELISQRAELKKNLTETEIWVLDLILIDDLTLVTLNDDEIRLLCKEAREKAKKYYNEHYSEDEYMRNHLTWENFNREKIYKIMILNRDILKLQAKKK